MTTSLAEVGEQELVKRLLRRLPAAGGTVIVGPGDDCAVVRPTPDATDDLVLTSDPVIEGVHMQPDADPGAIGHKAVARPSKSEPRSEQRSEQRSNRAATTGFGQPGRGHGYGQRSDPHLTRC